MSKKSKSKIKENSPKDENISMIHTQNQNHNTKKEALGQNTSK